MTSYLGSEFSQRNHLISFVLSFYLSQISQLQTIYFFMQTTEQKIKYQLYLQTLLLFFFSLSEIQFTVSSKTGLVSVLGDINTLHNNLLLSVYKQKQLGTVSIAPLSRREPSVGSVDLIRSHSAFQQLVAKSPSVGSETRSRTTCIYLF